jgi:4-diphosphocytidyl-2-C-methyl-D-erythritol kinase
LTLHLLAPAKLNLVLEITGKREDGYHEIRSIMQSIGLCDRVTLSPSPALELIVSGPEARGAPGDITQNLGYRAAVALQQAAGLCHLGARIELEKQIPAAAGLGGGSSDAAAVLRGLYELWDVDMSFSEFVQLAAGLGSDVPFFFDCGTQLVEGRGEELTPLPDAESPREFTLFTSDIALEDKTRRMYAALSPADFSNGDRTAAAAEAIWRGEPVGSLYNTFDRAVAAVFPTIGAAMARCRDAGIEVIAAGAGPSFFAAVLRDDLSSSLVAGLERDFGLIARAVRALSSADALAVEES